MPTHHSVAYFIRLFGALAGKVVNLRTVARRTSGGSPSSKNESASDSVIFFIGEVREPRKLRNRRRPEVVCALDDVCNMGRNLIRVFHREQISPHSLVNRILLAVPHQLLGLGSDTRQHPFAHLGRAHAGDLALGHFGHDLLNLDGLLGGVLDRGLAQRHVHQHATVVDLLVDVVILQFVIGQRAQGLADQAHHTDVLFAIGDHLGHERSVLAELAVGLRHGQQPDQLAATVVLAPVSASKAPHVLQRARRTVGTGLRCGADELLQLEVDLEDIPEYQALERGVVGVDQPGMIADSGWEFVMG